MSKAMRIWEVTINRRSLCRDERILTILAGEEIESALPKARKILKEIQREEKERWAYEIVKVERGRIVDAF